MKTTLKFMTCAVFALGLFGCETYAPTPPDAVQVAQDSETLATTTNVVVLVRTQQAANTLLVNAARRGYQLNTRTDLASLELIMLDFERPSGVSGDVAISDMQKMEPSATAGLDHRYVIQTQLADTSSVAPRLYAQSMLSWPATGCRAHVTVGMIDGEVNTASPTLSHADIVKKSFSKGAGGANAHGTAIANLLVGEGKLHGATLYSASVVADDGPGPLGAGVPELVRAIDWMQSEGVQLVNISLAGPYNAILERVVQRASSKGMVMIAAVGNDGPSALPRYPAAYREVIAVTAIDSRRNIYDRAVQGEHVDFSAPGVDVFVDSGARAQYLSGTSLAAPFVTVLIASDNGLTDGGTVQRIREQMGLGAVDLGPSGPDPVFGRGLVRASGNCDTENKQK